MYELLQCHKALSLLNSQAEFRYHPLLLWIVNRLHGSSLYTQPLPRLSCQSSLIWDLYHTAVRSSCKVGLTIEPERRNEQA